VLEPTRVESRAVDELTSLEKAAIILIALGKEISSQILRHMSDKEIERLSTEIVRVENIDSKTEMAVLKEFYSLLRASEYVSEGGMDYAREVLESSVGKNRSDDMLKRIQGTLNPSGFSLLKDVDPMHLLEFIRNEHPQTIALILSQLNPA